MDKQFEINFKEGEVIKYNGDSIIINIITYIAVLVFYTAALTLPISAIMWLYKTHPIAYWVLIAISPVLLFIKYVILAAWWSPAMTRFMWKNFKRRIKYHNKLKCDHCGLYDTEYNVVVCDVTEILDEDDNKHLCTGCLENYIMKDFKQLFK